MAYFTPYIDSAGFHIPTYVDIRDQLIEEAKSIFGQDVYLETDSADYQFISVVSLKMYDAMQAAQMAYNDRSPLTAVGTGLDAIVLLNGLARLPATYSTCQVKVSGTVGTVIYDGVIRDNNDLLWNLPATVTIPSAGHITVSATCQELGPNEAAIGEITAIVTPTAGWTAVTNEVQAIAGEDTETDAELRSRQALSVALPSQTLLEGTVGGVLAVANVTRAIIYENDTGEVSGEGFPAHSLTAVVEGGTDANIANAIYLRKGIGAYTNGTTSVTITDLNGLPTTIRFYRPTYVDIYVALSITRLTGWQPALETQIKTALLDYLNGLDLGETVVSISALWGIVMSQMPDLRNPIFSVTSLTAGTSLGTLGTTDIALDFDEASQTDSTKIVITLA